MMLPNHNLNPFAYPPLNVQPAIQGHNQENPLAFPGGPAAQAAGQLGAEVVQAQPLVINNPPAPLLPDPLAAILAGMQPVHAPVPFAAQNPANNASPGSAASAQTAMHLQHPY